MMHLVVAGQRAELRAVGLQLLDMARALGLPDLEADALGAIDMARVEAGGQAGSTTWRRPSPGSRSWAPQRDPLAPQPRLGGRDHGRPAPLLRRPGRRGAAGRAVRSWRWRRSIELQQVAELYWTGRWAEVVAVVDALLAGDERHYLEWECRLWRGRVHLAGGRLELALADAEAAHAAGRGGPRPPGPPPHRAFLAGHCCPPAAGTRPPRWPTGC